MRSAVEALLRAGQRLRGGKIAHYYTCPAWTPGTSGRGIGVACRCEFRDAWLKHRAWDRARERVEHVLGLTVLGAKRRKRT